MEILGIDLGALFQNPVTWISGLVIAVLCLPLATFLLDNVTQIVSDVLITINRKIIDNIPIAAIRDWLEDQQIKMLEKSIKKYQETIEKIKK